MVVELQKTIERALQHAATGESPADREVVWGDGNTIDRQIITATDLGAFGAKHFAIPFDAKNKAWVRFAVWDSAGNGGFVQPVWLNAPRTSTASR